MNQSYFLHQLMPLLPLGLTMMRMHYSVQGKLFSKVFVAHSFATRMMTAAHVKLSEQLEDGESVTTSMWKEKASRACVDACCANHLAA